MTTSQAIQPCLPPQARQFQDREGITDKHPSALIAAGTEITYSHPSALLAAGMEITSSHPSALTPAGTGITSSHPSACFKQQPISPDSCQGCPGDISVYIKF
ncbi:MAG: hypothetical protein PUC02_05800 [Bacteroidales bacterium]|nr:hypothetical protein [Bacteroidales bacterium]